MKKLLFFFLLFLLTSFVFAGGGQDVEPVEITGPVTIEFWHAMGGARIDLIQGIVDDFMAENPDITVNVQYTGSYNDTLNKTKAAAKAGNAPHVFHSYDVGTLQLVHSGIITPIEDVSEWDPINWDDFFARSGATIRSPASTTPCPLTLPRLFCTTIKPFSSKPDWIRMILPTPSKRLSSSAGN